MSQVIDPDLLDWPDSRAETYELACQQLVRELNDEHRNAKRTSAPTVDALLDAAGFLCAVHLLSGIAGFALDDAAADDQHALWRELSSPPDLPLLEALASGLFQRDDREQQRIPVHRSIAEYLGARYLAARIESQGLPLGRVIALMAGNDDGIVPDLRGLAAWLAVHCRSARSELIAREPLGDVRGFPPDGDIQAGTVEDKDDQLPGRLLTELFPDWTGLGQYESPIIDGEHQKSVKDRKQREEGWRSHFCEHPDAIRDGSAHPQILHELAEAYLREYLDIKGETPRERLTDFLGGDEELVDAACDGFRRSLSRDDLPSVAEIVDLEARGRMHFIRQPCLAGMEEQYAADPEAALHLDDAVLRKLLAFQYTWVAEKEVEWFVALVKSRPDLVAEVLVAYALPLWRKGHEHLHGIWELAYKDDYVDVARKALPDLLRGFPLRAKKQLLANALDPLLKAALRYLDRPALSALVAARLAQGSMSTAQRVYWLACGLLVAPAEYEAPLAKHIGASKALRGHLGAFLHDRERRPGFKSDLPESSLALLIELLAPDSPPEHLLGEGWGWVTPVMNTAEAVRGFIDTLGGKPGEAAARELERLAALPELAPWQSRLRHAAQAQRIARRKAEFRPPNVAEVCRTLANMQPANAADLAALAYDHLRDLADKIRNGSTNDYRQYWSYDTNGKPDRPKPENDCRDILLSDLAERLGRLGIDAAREGNYAESKRADIRLFFGGFNVPIEIKKDSHADLWRAIREQLIERYTRDPGADGFGIYLVFWFGGENMSLPQQGKKPRAAPELEERLRSTLTPEEGRRIRVCVIDCALPQKNQ